MGSGKAILVLSFLTAGSLIYGCSSVKRIDSAEVPKQPASNEDFGTAKTQTGHFAKYTVALHDTLWAIAGKSEIYNDNFQWPLIFKTNRDTIKDPDLIYPKQNFKIDTHVTKAEKKNARLLAQKTPKYVPHSKPRPTLPVDYF